MPQDCIERCDVLVACDDEYATVEACMENCLTQRESWAEHGTLCLEAYAANGYCIGSLTCAEYQEYMAPTTADYPCVGTFLELVNQCLFGGAGPSAECEAYCDVVLPCSNPPSVDRPYCLKQCGQWFYDGAEISQNCVVTVTALVDCVAALDCAGYAEYEAKEGDYPCKAEWEALETLCM